MNDYADMNDGESGAPSTSRTRFPRISHRSYEHPVALTALTTMRQIKGFDTALKGMSGAVSEPVIRMHHLSSAIRVGPRQFRHLHEIIEEAASILDLDDPPEVYVGNIGGVNAFTIGMKRPFVVISSGLIQIMDEGELRFVVGHELGHVLSGHAIYHTMGQLLANTVSLSSIPLVSVASEGIQAGIREWFRKSELSCDRAGLLVAQDPEAAIGALMKLAAGARIPGMSVDEFLQQAAEFELDTTGIRNRIYKFMLPSSHTHPILVLRAAELDRWVREGEYARIAADGEYESRDDDSQTTVRAQVKSGFAKVRETQRQKVADRLSRRSGQAPE
jgi:Zn-dependent protease with chaperone function